MRRSLFALAAAAALLPATAARAAEGDIIVQREAGLDSKDIRELRKDAGVKLVTALAIERTELVEPKDGDIAEALAELRADDDVVYAELDRRVSATVNDTYWPWLWGLNNGLDRDIDAPEAWVRSRGAGVTIAVADTGVNASHEDLAGQILPGGKDYVDDDDAPQDGNGHGTHVTGTIAALGDNGLGVVGVAPEAKILPLRVLDNAGNGLMSDLAQAFDYAGDLGVPVVNASLGGDDLITVRNVIASHPNTLYVVAAGNSAANNDDPSTADYPCAYSEPNVLCVGATGNSDLLADFSNYGATTVDLAAPGVSIGSTWHTTPNAYRWLDGTSMASPHAAGAAALALAAAPESSASQLKWALMSSVDVKPGLAGSSVTGGRLNAHAAVAAITGDAVPTPEPTPEPTATATPEPPVATPAPPAPQAPAPAPIVPVAPPAPTKIVAPPTSLFGVTVRGSLRTKRGKLKVRFSLSQPATVRFSIAKRGSRRALSVWTKKARAGASSVTIKRRLPTGKTLKRGTYTLAVGLNATASRSRSIRVR